MYVRRTELCGTTEEWEENNPILMNHEIGYEEVGDGSYKVKIGDGKTAWNDLAYSIDMQAIAADAAAAQAAANSATLSENNVAEMQQNYEQLKAQVAANVTASTDENADYAAEVVDARVGVDGTTYESLGEAIRQQFDDLGLSFVSDAEYVHAIVDADNRFLWGIRDDGSIEWAKGIPTPIQEKITALTENFEGQLKTETESRETLQASVEELQDLGISYTSNIGYVHAIVDADGKLLAGIQRDGGKHFPGNVDAGSIATDELTVAGSIATDELTVAGSYNWSDDNLTELEAALKTHGFATTAPVDWSDATSLIIPEPRCAIANISGISSWPTSKFQDSQCWLEFWDCNGNYFKKRIIFNAQGNSSLGFVKKNGSIDICNDEWVGDDTFSLKIGEWVEQDSFHLKAFYTDYFRGVAMVSYQLMDEVVRTRGLYKDRPWKKALIDYDSVTTAATAFDGEDDNSLELDTGARNFPDGFPCVFYLNGEFYGLYTWQLKKHRDNFHMTKDEPGHIWLDGTINTTTLLAGTIDWDGQFEVRNPKNLYLMDGTEYDADTNYGELIDDTSAYYDLATDSSKVKTRKQTTAKVKASIVALSTALVEIRAARDTYNSDKTDENLQALKTLYETYFDVENQIDYLIVSDVVKNSDGFSKNWQWATYDGVKWYINIYDVDMSFGSHWEGNQITGPLSTHINTSSHLPSYYVINYYTDELKARYAELRDAGIIDVEHIVQLLNTWCKRFGVDMYDAEFEKWADCPCHGESILNDGWELVAGEMGTDSTYDSATTYAVGDTCTYGLNGNMGYFTFVATAKVTGVAPVATWKYTDSIYRVRRWLETEIANMDTVYGYSG